VVQMSNNRDFARAIAALSTIESGLIVLIAGNLSAATARELAATRRDGRQGIALLLATSTWGTQAEADHDHPSPAVNGQAGPAAQAGSAPDGLAGHPAVVTDRAETAAAEIVLRAAGWRVVTIDAATPLSLAWQRLPKAGNLPPLASQLDPAS
jgi:hypothetical protein